MKKRYVFILLAAVLLCGTVFPSAALTYTVGIGVSAPDTAVPGETVVYVISVDPAQASGGIVTLNFNLSYDETYLTFQSVTSSAPDGWSFYSNCKNGVVYLMSEAPYGASGYHTPVTAAGQLLYTVTFTANSVQGSTQIATKGNVSGTETDGLGLVYGNPVSATLQISASHAVSFDANGGSGAPDGVWNT